MIKVGSSKTENPSGYKVLSLAVTCTSKAKRHHEDNTHCQFSVDLAETILLPGEGWKLCLKSCSLPTRFKLPFESQDRTLQLKVYEAQGTSVSRQSVTFPSSLHSTEEIAFALNLVLTKSQGQFMKDKKTGNLAVQTDKQMELLCRSKLAHFLGASSAVLKDPILRLRIFPGKTVLFPFGPRFSENLSSSIMIYNKQIDTTCVAGLNLRLLKIVPASFSKSSLTSASSNLNMTEFKNLDYHNLKASQLTTLSFEIRDHSGNLVQFASDSPPVLLNLLLSKGV